MLNIVGFVILILGGIAILGPEKLPVGVEALSLNLLNFSRSQSGQPPLTLEDAQEHWRRSDSFIFSIVRFLRAAQEHLLELRGRIFKTTISIAVAAVIAGVVSNYILQFLVQPAGITLIFLHPTEMFSTYIMVIITTAIALSVPVILYHVLAFIRPALENPKEEKVFRLIVFIAAPFSLLFFAGGVAFSYFVMLPFALSYLARFGTTFAEAAWTIRGYISFVTSMLFWIGVAFETPLIMFVLARAGIVSARRFGSIRKFAYVGIAAAAAVITPTPDAFNMLLVMAPLALLYEFGVILARIGGKRSEPEPEGEGGDEPESGDEAGPGTEAEPEPEPGDGTGPESASVADAGDEPTGESEAQPGPEAEVETEALIEPEAGPEAAPEAESEVGAETEVLVKPEAEPEAVPGPESELGPDVEPQATREPEAEPGSEPDI